jgi:3-dehydroquinate synthase
MGVDKKARGSHLRLVVLDGLARPSILDDPPEELLWQAYQKISSWPNGPGFPPRPPLGA